MPTPVIRQLKRAALPEANSIAILDSPPGASCPVVETLRGCDFALLVTEPTPFGLHDLNQVITIVEEMSIPSGIVVNRDGIGGDSLERFLAENGRTALMRIPYRRELAEGIAAGKTIIDIMPEYKDDFKRLFRRIKDSLEGGGV
jgi:MinD superfamily P-loop ATPase